MTNLWPHSVYVVIRDRRDGDNTRVLFLKRSNRQWWLPGGTTGQLSHFGAMRSWFAEMVHLNTTPPSTVPHLEDYVGTWKLSPEAGDGDVHLYQGGVCVSEATLRTRGPEYPLAQELAWFGAGEIRQHLYEERDITWGQAKLAISCLYERCAPGRPIVGELLRADLGILNGENWARPN